MKLRQQFDLACAVEAFNLASEQGIDPERVIRERIAADKAKREAAEFQERMQRTLAQCPGAVGFDVPSCSCGKGKVVVEPARISEAMPWLKRRFHVSESLELSTDTGLCVEIAPRNQRSPTKGKRVKVSFEKPTQFTLPLGL